MSLTLLWPLTRWGDDNVPEIETAGKEVNCIFAAKPADVTDEQWAEADALISVPDPLLTEDVHKIPNCKIFVTPKVGFDNIDLEKYGRLGIPVQFGRIRIVGGPFMPESALPCRAMPVYNGVVMRFKNAFVATESFGDAIRPAVACQCGNHIQATWACLSRSP